MNRRTRPTGLRAPRYLLWALIWLAAAAVAMAADPEIEGEGDLSFCKSYSWAPQEKIPIFDPLTSLDSPEYQKNLDRLDQHIRSEVESRLSRRGWTKTETGQPDCLIRYSLIQGLGLDSTTFGSGGIAPRSNDGYESGLSGSNANMQRNGNFTLEVLRPGEDRWIWRGLVKDSLGKAKDVPDKVKGLIKDVVEEIPRVS